MKKSALFFSLFLLCNLFATRTFTQTKTELSIDEMLLQGAYKEVLAKCVSLFATDSTNAELYYKAGLAYQNMMLTEKAIKMLSKALSLLPESEKYRYALARQYFSNGRNLQAEPLFAQLFQRDSTNWAYAYFVTDLLQQKANYSTAYTIYKRFFESDTTNFALLNKMAFCEIKEGRTRNSIELYKKSLKINSDNIGTLKNLSFIYHKTNKPDSALDLLNYAIQLDSTDMDLYQRRGDVFYTQNYHFRSRPDYMKILAAGDSTKEILKKVGIGYAYNENPNEAIKYFNWALLKDSTDFEIYSYLGQAYNKLKKYDLSAEYYKKSIEMTFNITKQHKMTYSLLAGNYMDSKDIQNALDCYTKALTLIYDPKLCLVIANIYDEKLNKGNLAVQYYEKFLSESKNDDFIFSEEYLVSIRERADWLRKNSKKK